VHVFVYGTLTDPARVADVLGTPSDASDREHHDAAAPDDDGNRALDDAADPAGTSSWSFVADATLWGLHRVDGRYPTLAPGGRVDGRLLATDAIGALDAYEGVDRGLYVRVPVPSATGGAVDGDPGAAAVYVGDPERLDADEPVAWPGDGDLERRVRRYVDANEVVVDPR
jgi:hypothetical protein